MTMNRRELLQVTGSVALGAGLSAFPFGWTPAQEGKKKRVLMFTRSQGFQHPVVNRNDAGKEYEKGKKRLGEPGKLAHAEQILTELGIKHGFEVTATKDGRIFVPEEIAKYDAFFFYTTGDLTADKATDGSPPMPKEGKRALLDAIASGKGFLGSHCASDTFHSRGEGRKNQAPDERDPYIQMLGGEFIVHGAQQKAWMRVTDPAFPGAKEQKDFQLNEEWYALKNFASNLHVILAQDSEGMNGAMYQRAWFPATWARMHEKGRVFYTSMGHREDVWTNPIFHQILLGGLAWALHNVDADIAPNFDKVTPKAAELSAG
jgi:type 1 glutamine amidotransferase